MTVAFLLEDWEHPASKGFVDRIEAAVQTLAVVPGFIASDFDESPVWGEVILPSLATRPELTNRCAYTLSLWEDLESVFAYSYNAAHGEALRHRREWFRNGEWPSHVAWWVPNNHVPTRREASEHWEYLSESGPSAKAFDFRHAYDAEGRPTKVDRERVRAKAALIPLIDWRPSLDQESG